MLPARFLTDRWHDVRRLWPNNTAPGSAADTGNSTVSRGEAITARVKLPRNSHMYEYLRASVAPTPAAASPLAGGQPTLLELAAVVDAMGTRMAAQDATIVSHAATITGLQAQVATHEALQAKRQAVKAKRLGKRERQVGLLPPSPCRAVTPLRCSLPPLCYRAVIPLRCSLPPHTRGDTAAVFPPSPVHAAR